MTLSTLKAIDTKVNPGTPLPLVPGLTETRYTSKIPGLETEIQKFRDIYEVDLSHLGAKARLVLKLFAAEYSVPEISTMVSLDAAVVQKMVTTPMAKSILEQYLKERVRDIRSLLREEAEQLGLKALAVHELIMSDPNTRDDIKLKAAKNILEYSGLGNTIKHNVHTVLTASDILRIKESAMEQINKSQVIDIPISEVTTCDTQ